EADAGQARVAEVRRHRDGGPEDIDEDVERVHAKPAPLGGGFRGARAASEGGARHGAASIAKRRAASRRGACCRFARTRRRSVTGAPRPGPAAVGGRGRRGPTALGRAWALTGITRGAGGERGPAGGAGRCRPRRGRGTLHRAGVAEARAASPATGPAARGGGP